MICSICLTEKNQDEFVYRRDREKLQKYCKACKRKIDKEWATANKDKRRASKTKCDKKLRQTRLATRLKDNLRSRLNTAVYNYLAKGRVSHVRHLGCTITELIAHIESQFYPHPVTGKPMTWTNRGSGPGTWQIDHVIPLCSAVSSEAELLKCVSYSNLRPLWWEEHAAKSQGERTDTATHDQPNI